MKKETKVKTQDLVENILDIACETISEMKKGDFITHGSMAELLDSYYPSPEYYDRQGRLRLLLIDRHQLYLVNSYRHGYVLAKNGKEHEVGIKKIKGAVETIDKRADEIVKISPSGKTRQQVDELITVQQTTGRFAERVKSGYRDLVRKTNKETEAEKTV